MSFEIVPVNGTVNELESDLASLPKHEREELVIPAIKKAIAEIVDALGGYLSVSANGNLNPVSGENGDLVNIYITSLSAPAIPTTPAETPPVTEVKSGEPVPVSEEIGQTQPVIPPENVEPVQPITEETEGSSALNDIPPGEPVTVTEVEATTNSGEVTPVITPGQAEAQEIAQATPPVIQEIPVAVEPSTAPQNSAEIPPVVPTDTPVEEEPVIIPGTQPVPGPSPGL